MYYALVVRFQTLPKIEKPSQRLWIWVSIAIVTLLTFFFIIVPVIPKLRSWCGAGKLLNIIYPLTDLVMMVLVLRIFFNLQGGLNGRAWVWMTIAFFILAVSDLLFSYATMHDLYSQSEEGNLFSTLVVDLPYNVSYMFVVIGLYHLRLMHRSYQHLEIKKTTPAPVANCHILLFADANDLVTEVSHNAPALFSSGSIIGLPVAQFIRYSAPGASSIIDTIHSHRILAEQSAILNSARGPISIKISGEALTDYASSYLGGIFLIRGVAESENADQVLTDYQKGIVKSIMAKAGGEQNELNEKKEFLIQFYLPRFSTLYNLALSEGGSLMADAFLYEIREYGRSKNWEVGLRVNRMLDLSNIHIDEAQIALPALLEQAKKQIVNILDEDIVQTQLAALSDLSNSAAG
jgi:hypothetical protein